MRTKYGFSLLALVLAFVMISGACSSGNSSAPSYNKNESGSSGGYAVPESALDYESYDSYSYMLVTSKEDPSLPALESKIIWNGSADLRAKDAVLAYGAIAERGIFLGGWEHSYSINNYETYSVIRATIKIPPENFKAFMDFIVGNEDEWETVNNSAKSDDITENYYDTKTRLETKRRSLEKYYDLLAQASGIEEIVYLQRTIDSITEEIEAHEGRLRVWDSQVSMATVTLYIRQDNDPIEIKKEIHWDALTAEDMSYLIRSGFVGITNTVVSVLQWAVIILIAYSPIWVVLAVALIVWRRIRKKRRQKAAISENIEQ